MHNTRWWRWQSNWNGRTRLLILSYLFVVCCIHSYAPKETKTTHGRCIVLSGGYIPLLTLGVDNLRLVIIVMTWTYYCGGGQKQIVVALQYSYLNACELHIPTDINLPGETQEGAEEVHWIPLRKRPHMFPLFVLILFGFTTSNERQQFYNNRHSSLEAQPSVVSCKLSCRSIFSN